MKDHYQVDKKLGDWSDILRLSKNANIMADVVINHSSSKGLWFKNFLKDNVTAIAVVDRYKVIVFNVIPS